MLVKFNEIKGMSVQGINNETDMMVAVEEQKK